MCIVDSGYVLKVIYCFISDKCASVRMAGCGLNTCYLFVTVAMDFVSAEVGLYIV